MIISPNVAFLATLYFLQGLPYGLQSRFLPLYFRTHGMALSSISMLKLLLTPWMLKALWSPLVDKYGSKRKWLLYSMMGLALSCLVGSYTNPEYLPPLVFILFLFNFLTATQDIAVDGIAIQILTTTELAGGNIAQVVGYKIGSVFSGGLLTWLSDYLSWAYLFVCLSFIYAAAFLFVYKMVKLDSSEEEVYTAADKGKGKLRDVCSKGDDERHYSCDNKDNWILQHVKQIMNTEGTWWIAVFVLLYKLGEQGSLSMTPLFLVDHKMAVSSVGLWTGVIGQVISIAGSLMGGWLISVFRFTPFEVLKFFCQFRLVPLTIQFIVTLFLTDSDNSSTTGSLLYAVSVGSMCLMLLVSGAITTATFTMMMHCSQNAEPSVQASHYTFIATLEVLGKLTFSVFLGFLTDFLGYSLMFLLLVLLSAILVPVLPRCPKVLLEMSTVLQSRNKKH